MKTNSLHSKKNNFFLFIADDMFFVSCSLVFLAFLQISSHIHTLLVLRFELYRFNMCVFPVGILFCMVKIFCVFEKLPFSPICFSICGAQVP